MKYRIITEGSSMIVWNANGITYVKDYDRQAGSFEDDGTIMSHIVDSALDLDFNVEQL